MPRDDVIVAVHEWSSIAHAAEAALAMAAARLDECGPPPDAGTRDAAEWMAKSTGTTASKAKTAIATGQQLRKRRKTRAAATAGQLSPDQSAAIADATAVNPDAEDSLLDHADKRSVGELRRKCAEAKTEKEDIEAIERRIHANRGVRRWNDAEGAAHLHAVGTKRQMAVIDQALKTLTDEQFKKARAEGIREPLEAYMFDALVEMADATLRGGEPNRKTKQRDPIRHLTVLRLDLAALTRGRVENGETCEIAGLGPVSVATAREMLGASVVKLVLTKGVEVRNVTHLGRGPTVAQKIAMLWEQPICTRLGCGRAARLEYDHSEDWALTHHTVLDELEPLCHPDHRLKTLEGWSLVEGTGTREMVPPTDPRHPKYERPPPEDR